MFKFIGNFLKNRSVFSSVLAAMLISGSVEGYAFDRDKEVEKLLELMGFYAMEERTLNNMHESLRSNPKVRENFKNSQQRYVKTLASTMSEADIVYLQKVYSSSLGKRFIDAQIKASEARQSNPDQKTPPPAPPAPTPPQAQPAQAAPPVQSAQSVLIPAQTVPKSDNK